MKETTKIKFEIKREKVISLILEAELPLSIKEVVRLLCGMEVELSKTSYESCKNKVYFALHNRDGSLKNNSIMRIKADCKTFYYFKKDKVYDEGALKQKAKALEMESREKQLETKDDVSVEDILEIYEIISKKPVPRISLKFLETNLSKFKVNKIAKILNNTNLVVYDEEEKKYRVNEKDMTYNNIELIIRLGLLKLRNNEFE